MEFLASAIMEMTGDIVFGKKVLSCWDVLGGLNSHDHCLKENCSHPRIWGNHPRWIWNENLRKNILRQEKFKEQILTYFGTKRSILNVKTLTGKNFEVLVDRSCSVLTLKEKIQDAEGYPPNQQMLISSRVTWEDRRAISDYKIENNTVHCVCKLGAPIPNASILVKEMFDPSKNCDFTWLQDDGQIYKRGNHVYQRPYGWNRISFNVKNKYDDNKWLGEDPGSDFNRTQGLKDEWPMAYHGMKKLLHTMLQTEDSNPPKSGELVRGFYSCPDPKVAEESAPVFTYNSRKFKVMIQSRVNMNDTLIVGDQRFYATANPENIRPVGLLIKSL